ncbi:MAG: VOC family protein [Bauldia sp.]|nr:VOC family protein [Bauldia sp.]
MMALGGCDLVAFVATARPDEARTFYRDILGLRLIEDFRFALVFDANGTMLRIAKVDVVAPSTNAVLGWGVENLARTMDELAAKGIAFEWYPGLNDPETGIWTTERGDRVVWFKDPDGNLLSLTEFAARPAT